MAEYKLAIKLQLDRQELTGGLQASAADFRRFGDAAAQAGDRTTIALKNAAGGSDVFVVKMAQATAGTMQFGATTMTMGQMAQGQFASTARAAAQTTTAIADSGIASEKAAGGYTSAARGVRSISDQLGQASMLLQSYLSLQAGVGAARWIVEQASDLKQLEGRLRTVTDSTSDFNFTYAGALALANRSGAALAETVGAFTRLNPTIKDMGGNSAVTLRMLAGLNASLKLSGASTGEVNAVMLQFSQAMGSGRVGGDEFRSMMESAQPLMRAVAKELGISTGALRQMAEEGRLTSSVFANAMLPAIDKLLEGAKKIEPTVGQAFQVLKNNALKDFGREFEDTTVTMGRAIGFVANHTLELAAAGHALISALGTVAEKAAIVAGGAALGAMVLTLGAATVGTGTLVAGLGAVNAVTVALVTSAAIAKLERLSVAGKAGLLGLVFWGAYEVTDFLTSLGNVRTGIVDLLTPVFEAYDRLGADAQRKNVLAVSDAKAKLKELQDLKAAGTKAQLQDTTVLGLPSKKMVPIDDLIASAAADTQRLEKAYESMYQAPSRAQQKASPANRLSSAGEYETLTKDLKYREKIIVEYDAKLLNLRQSYADKYAATDEKLRPALQQRQQKELAAMLAERKSALEGAGDFKAAKEQSELSSAKALAVFEGYQADSLRIFQQGEKDLESERKRGLITEETYFERRLALALQQNRDQQRIVEQELATARKYAAGPKEKQAVELKYGAELKKLLGEQLTLQSDYSRAVEEEKRKHQDALNKIIATNTAMADKDLDAQLKVVDSMVSGNEQLRNEIAVIGLSERARAKRLQVLEREAIAELEIRMIGAQNDEQRTGEVALLEREIALRQQRVALLDKKQVAEDAKTVADGWAETFKDIERGLTDSLYRAFESGRKFFSTLWSGIKNQLKTTVLKVLIQPVTGALGLSGAATNLLGGAGAGSGGIGSMLSSITGFGGISSAITGGLAAGFGGLTGTIGSLFGAAGTGATLSGALSAGSIALGAGNIVGGLSTLAGALGPIAIGVAAVAAIFGKKESASVSTGSLYRSFDADGNTTASRSPFAIGNAEEVVGIMQAGFTSLKNQLGATGASNFSYNAYSGNGNKGGKFNISGGNFQSGEVATEEAAIKLAAARAVLGALQLSEMPRELAGLFKGLNAASMSEEQITQVYEYASALRALDASLQVGPFEQLKNMSYETAAALIAASGGIGNLQANLSSYFQGFYSAEEQRAQKQNDITAKLNAAGVDAGSLFGSDDPNVAFRTLVESFGQATEATAPMLGALYAVAGEFANLYPLTTSAASGIAGLSDTLKSLKRDRSSLEADLMQAQGDTEGASTARRTIDITGYSEAEIAAYDYNQTLRAQIAVLNDAKAAQEAAAAERQTLQDQLNALTDTEIEALARRREAIGESNRALFDEVEARKTAKGLAQQRGQMDIQLMELQGNSAGALAARRAIEIAALDASLLPMQMLIYGLQDMATAAQVAAVAANEAGRLYFLDLDRQANITSLTSSADAALDKMFGSIADSSSAGVDAAQAANSAAKDAATNWRAVSSAIRSALDSIKEQTTQLLGNNYKAAWAQFQTYTVLARGGDVASAGKVAGAAQSFLAASQEKSVSLIDVLRDRGRIEQSLTETLGTADAMASAQDLIVNATQATVSQLQSMNATLTGFAKDVYDVLRGGYSGANREQAGAVSAKFATLTADLRDYFSRSKEGDTRQWGNGMLKRLGGDMTEYTRADGTKEYLRATETALEIARRLPEIRAIWEQQYGLTLPSFAVGTSFVPRDMVANIHQGERIMTREENQAYGSGRSSGGSGYEALVVVIAEALDSLKNSSEITANSTKKLSDMTETATDSGRAYLTEAYK